MKTPSELPAVDLKVEIWLIARPIPYYKNARKCPQAAIDKVAASLREYGWQQPIVVDLEGVIVVGHTRLLAAKKLGMTEVPVVVARNLTPAQIKAYRIMDNRSAQETSWDLDLLGVELLDLKDLGVDLTLTGFDYPELGALLAGPEAAAGGAGEDVVQEPPAQPVTVLGDLWLLGEHRVLCGDSISVDAVSRLLDGRKADMVFTDPPYGIKAVKGGQVGDSKAFGSTGNAGGKLPFGGKKGHVHGERPLRGRLSPKVIPTNFYAPIIGDDSTNTAIAAYNLCSGLAIPVLIFWGGNYYADRLPPSRCWIVWDKEVTGSFADVEIAWTNLDKVARLFRHQWSGLMKASERGERRVHPTQKPVALAVWCLEEFGKAGDKVLDLFLGSGSTLIACEKTGRTCLGMELSPDYVDVVVQRWQTFAGKQATLDGDGRSFDELKALRKAA
jgi:16S rRNA G966 N2-methylase RsmD